MTEYTITIQRRSDAALQSIRWVLDHPLHQQDLSLKTLTEQGIRLQGWALHIAGKPLKLLVLEDDLATPISLSRARPDVIAHVFQNQDLQHPQLQCGFKYTFKPVRDNFQLVVQCDGEQLILADCTIKGRLTVLQGEANWLFLANDNNQSVEQYTGQLLLTRTQRNAWQRYFRGLFELTAKANLPHAFLVAPAKEVVYPQYYPYTKAKRTVMEQLQELVPSPLNFLYPVKQLQQAAARTFRITDTHWSFQGAAVATIELAAVLQLDATAVRALFERDRYEYRLSLGDLGNKLFPPQYSEEAHLARYRYQRKRVYDNGLPNFGRIQIFHHQKALYDQHCVIFGSSSTYTMLNYLTRVFKHLTLIHSAGNIDTKLIEQLQPDCVVAQTNARFVILPPRMNYSVQNSMAQKIQELGRENKSALLKGVTNKPSEQTESHVRIVHAVFLAALAECESTDKRP